MIRWAWQEDLEDDEGFTDYDKATTAKIEKAYQNGAESVKISRTHTLNFRAMIQHATKDWVPSMQAATQIKLTPATTQHTPHRRTARGQCKG